MAHSYHAGGLGFLGPVLYHCLCLMEILLQKDPYFFYETLSPKIYQSLLSGLGEMQSNQLIHSAD